MEIILWRHAQAEEAEPDMARALTAHGRKQARRMAEWLTCQLPENCRILVSPAVRTVQTAEALGRKFKIHPDLAPGASVEAVLQAAHWPSAKESVLVVGHQPTLGLVAAQLLSGQQQYWNIKKAALWWIAQSDPNDPDSLYLKAVMGPELMTK